MSMKIDPRLRGINIPPLLLESNLNTNERMCLGVIIMYGEVAFPSHDKIAKRMGCSIDTVKRTVITLKLKKWIQVEARRDEKTGRQKSNRYIVGVPPSFTATGTHAVVQDAPRTTEQPAPAPSANCTTIKNKNLNSEEEEQLPGVPKPTEPPATVTVSRETSRKDYPVVKELLDHFAVECNKASGYTPVRQWGRDIKMMRDILRICDGLPEHVTGMMVDWMRWRVGEGKIVAMPAFRGAAETAHLKWMERKGKIGPKPREHPMMAQIRREQEHKKNLPKGGVDKDSV